MTVNASGAHANGPQMSNVTRYLCAAAYLDSGFRDRVLAELLFDSYRAVPPSYGGFDLMPVIHHCRRSRAMLLVRDALITAFFVIGILLAPLSTIGWVGFLVPFALLTVRAVRRGPLIVRGLIWFWAIYQVIALPLFAGSAAVLSLLGGARAGLDYDPITGTITQSNPLAVLFGGLVQGLLVPLATLGIALIYRVATYMTLAGTLRPGTPEPVTKDTGFKTGRRLDYIRRAQWGNITMYDDENPFIGAGVVTRSWSIAVELDRVRTGTGNGSATGNGRQAEPVEIDPVELHGFVRERLIDMRDRVRRPNEGIQRLDIGDHVVTRGLFRVADWHDDRKPLAHPLMGQDGLPRFLATPEEIAAIVRHPQGGVRYYQRVTINNAGQEIRDLRGNLVAPAEDQEMLTSAFIYLAVEGRMLYTQFVVTVLPPADRAYHVVDLLPTMTGPRIAWEAVRVLRLWLLRDVLAAPIRLARAGVQAVLQSVTTPDPRQYRAYPYGARISVREVGASEGLQTYIQELDAAKYTKLIEQRLTEAVLDFLEERKVETGGYRLQAANVTMNNDNRSWSDMRGAMISGAVGIGTGASATVHNPGRAGG